MSNGKRGFHSLVLHLAVKRRNTPLLHGPQRIGLGTPVLACASTYPLTSTRVVARICACAHARMRRVRALGLRVCVCCQCRGRALNLRHMPHCVRPPRAQALGTAHARREASRLVSQSPRLTNAAGNHSPRDIYSEVSLRLLLRSHHLSGSYQRERRAAFARLPRLLLLLLHRRRRRPRGRRRVHRRAGIHTLPQALLL